ncbi:hypothetical protein JKF63_01999 [Porcisia hertigi]|uniref:Palmitoyltransferase n=1 Tax=Porcisia hertigi TaxID=2761500 RepID=A0A836L0W7_9TRYP|nr:hypothetical protein JKF63_01999 [Porcisia hertigi]
MNADTSPLNWQWSDGFRRTICGFNVARDCLGGLALLLCIPPAVVVHLSGVILTPTFTSTHSGTALFLEVLAELFLCIGAVVFLFLLLVADPGFTEAPTDLSCRCKKCGVEVEGFDHHCGAVGACVGKSNMCYFILFLMFAALLCALVGLQNIIFVATAIRAYRHEAGSSWTSLAALKKAALAVLSSSRTLVLIVLSGAAVTGGVYCTFLWLRYIYLAHMGLDSVRGRRRLGTRGSLSAVFSYTLHPKLSHNNFIFRRQYDLLDVSS